MQHQHKRTPAPCPSDSYPIRRVAARARRLGFSEGRGKDLLRVEVLDIEERPPAGGEREVWHRVRSGAPHLGRGR